MLDQLLLSSSCRHPGCRQRCAWRCRWHRLLSCLGRVGRFLHVEFRVIVVNYPHFCRMWWQAAAFACTSLALLSVPSAPSRMGFHELSDSVCQMHSDCTPDFLIWWAHWVSHIRSSSIQTLSLWLRPHACTSPWVRVFLSLHGSLTQI